MPPLQTEDATLVYPRHEISPEDFLHFYQLDGFVDAWKSLGFDEEEDLWALEISIMANPEAGEVISGTGGLRKMRFGKSHQKTGKRKGVRVCYVYFKEHWTVLLVVVYGKNKKTDLTQDEKKHIQDYIKRSKEWLNKNNY